MKQSKTNCACSRPGIDFEDLTLEIKTAARLVAGATVSVENATHLHEARRQADMLNAATHLLFRIAKDLQAAGEWGKE